MKRIVCFLIAVVCVVILVSVFNMHSESIAYMRGIVATKPMWYCPLMSQINTAATLCSVPCLGFTMLSVLPQDKRN